uniref:DNA (cytosine-5-)-methyltransferase n=1 Tax=viral metagenome TaxID=1070528 RepID=A0A6C0D2G2_9ZZZZ
MSKVDKVDKVDKIDNVPKESKTVRYIDLFCGLGAFHYAFNSLQTEQTTYECVFACDIDENVRKIYEENYGIKPEGDINTINIETIPDFDILCGGFPCQPFSIAGKKEGFEDKLKGNLFYTILKIIDIKTPSTIILENVKNLQTIHGGETFNTIKAELQKRGYMLSVKVIDSKYYHSPQSRQRLFIVGDKTKEYEFPFEPTNKITPVSSIIDYNETRYLKYEDKYNLEKCKETRNNKNNCKMLFKLVHKITKKGGRQGERVYSIDSCGPTICASSGGPGAKTGLYYVNTRIRRLNAKEGLKMFGFEETFKWKTMVREEDMLFYLGNCIVVNVVRTLLSKL